MSDREIFVYRHPVSGEAVHADPVALQRRLTIHSGGNLNELLRRWQSGDVLAAADAEERLMDIVRLAFELPGIDPATGQGAGDRDCRAVLREYLDFFGESEPRVGSTPTSPAVMAPTP